MHDQQLMAQKTQYGHCRKTTPATCIYFTDKNLHGLKILLVVFTS
jgi:hypothetical protein